MELPDDIHKVVERYAAAKEGHSKGTHSINMESNKWVLSTRISRLDRSRFDILWVVLQRCTRREQCLSASLPIHKTLFLDEKTVEGMKRELSAASETDDVDYDDYLQANDMVVVGGPRRVQIYRAKKRPRAVVSGVLPNGKVTISATGEAEKEFPDQKTSEPSLGCYSKHCGVVCIFFIDLAMHP